MEHHTACSGIQVQVGSQERQSVVRKVGRSLGIVAAEDIQGGWGEEPETVVVVEIEKVLEGRVLGETCSVSLKSANCPSCHSHVCNKEKKRIAWVSLIIRRKATEISTRFCAFRTGL